MVVAPYILLSGGISFAEMSTLGWIMLDVVGIVHAGIAYALYFGGIRDVNAQTAAILSYLDPVLSIILSALILWERMDAFSILGAVPIWGSALCSELPGRKNKHFIENRRFSPPIFFPLISQNFCKKGLTKPPCQVIMS